MTGPGAADFEEIRCLIRPASVEEVDDTGYLDANPDVRAAGMAAADHFSRFGRQEGRQQWANQAGIPRLREAKLRGLRFRVPAAPRREGAAADYLSPEQRRAFRFPEAPPVSSNAYGDQVIELIRANPDKKFLDVGAGVRQIYFSNVVNTEIFPWPSTDVVCVGEDLPFEANQFDYVFSFAVLEHTRRPWDVAREMCRVLKPGGELWVDYPFLQPVHGYPHHYFNATPMGSASLFEAYCDIKTLEIFDNNHPIWALTWILRLWHNGLPAADAARFDDLRIGELLALSAEAQMAGFFSQHLDAETRRTIAAGSGLRAVKRRVTIEPAASPERENPYRDALETMRNSASWRMTAPLRALARMFAR